MAATAHFAASFSEMIIFNLWHMSLSFGSNHDLGSVILAVEISVDVGRVTVGFGGVAHGDGNGETSGGAD